MFIVRHFTAKPARRFGCPWMGRIGNGQFVFDVKYKYTGSRDTETIGEGDLCLAEPLAPETIYAFGQKDREGKEGLLAFFILEDNMVLYTDSNGQPLMNQEAPRPAPETPKPPQPQTDKRALLEAIRTALQAEPAGRLRVETGCLLLGDPLFLKGNERVEPNLDLNSPGAIFQGLDVGARKPHYFFKFQGLGTPEAAFIINTQGNDGKHDVFLVRDANGRSVGMYIDLTQKK